MQTNLATVSPARRSKKVKMVIPREHGSWAMWIVPFFLGITLTHFKVDDWVLLISVLFAFAAATPATLLVKQPAQKATHVRWLGAYLIVSGIGLVWLIPRYPELLVIGLLALPSLIIDFYFIRRRKERHLVNDLTGIFALNLAIIATYYVGSGHLSWQPVYDIAILLPYFFGSALHVKALIRERKNRMWKRIAIAYHVLLVIGYAASGLSLWLVVLALAALVRVLAQPQTSTISVLSTGVIEIGMAILLLLVFTASYRPLQVQIIWHVLGIILLGLVTNFILGLVRHRWRENAGVRAIATYLTVPIIAYIAWTMHIPLGWWVLFLYGILAGQLWGAKFAGRRLG